MTAPAPLAIQLYTLREQLQADLSGVIERLAEIGFLGVEPFGLDIARARETARVCQALGLAIPAFHGKLPLGDDQAEALEIAAALGATYWCAPASPPKTTRRMTACAACASGSTRPASYARPTA